MADDATTSASTDAGSTDAATQTETAAQNTPSTTSTQVQTTYTQDELDKIVDERVNKSKAQFKDYSQVKAQAAQVSGLSDQITKLTAEKAEAQSDFTAAKRDVDLLKVALEKKVPVDLLGRLQGNTPEEIAADADLLMSKLAPQSPLSGFNGGTAPGGAPLQGGDALGDALRQAAGL